MSGVKIFLSNRLEALARELASVVRSPLPSPMDGEVIIVQNIPMARWLSLELAGELGIWGNGRFILPNSFIQGMFELTGCGTADSRFIDADVMSWKLMGLLPEYMDRPGFEIIKKYLSMNRSGKKEYQLSLVLAELFDQYLTYRPEMILKWDTGGKGDWQQVLWDRIAGDRKNSHPPALKKRFVEILSGGGAGITGGLPPRISLFGISSLPPFHIDTILALSSVIDVNMFLVSPSSEYWFDIRSDREITGAMRKRKGKAADRDALHLYRGNSLLSSLGKTGKEFFNLVMEGDWEQELLFHEPGSGCLLHIVQGDILNLRERGKAGGEDGDRIAMTGESLVADDSIRIHSCHNPLREVEVLREFLIDLFNRDPSMKPGDIAVICPDLEAYAPYVESVFTACEDERMKIPFSITGRRAGGRGGIIDAFLSILDISEKRFRTGSVIKILECPDVMRAFDLSPSDMPLVSKWVRETNIRWGYDGKSKEKLGLPIEDENTWESAFARLVLGVAMQGGGERFFNGILPYDDIEGPGTRVLGRFIDFFRKLAGHADALSAPGTLLEWMDRLNGICRGMFAPDGNSEKDFLLLSSVMDGIGKTGDASAYAGKVTLDVMKIWIQRGLMDHGEHGRFFTGAVTITSMKPLRSIPFRVICMTGLNEGVFPRRDRELAFDLMAAEKKPGDRSYRNEDRYFFLETLISARDKLFISYTGQSAYDNSRMPPSPVVDELADYIEESIDSGGLRARDHIVIHHPLQAFSRKYFTGADTFYSYSEENCSAAGLVNSSRRTTRDFTGILPGGEDLTPEISVEQLLNFFSNPARYLIANVCKIRLGNKPDAWDEREPFELSGLESFFIKSRISDSIINGRPAGNYLDILKATGSLPHGRAGDAVYRGAAREAEIFSSRVKKNIAGNRLDDIDVDLALTSAVIRGRVANIWENRHIVYRPSKTKARDRLHAWILHLLLNAVQESSASARGIPAESLFISNEDTYSMPCTRDSMEFLEGLVSIYKRGCRELVPFFPETSYCYAEKYQGNDRIYVMEKCSGAWLGRNFMDGEYDDIYNYRCYRNSIPHESREFMETAVRVYEPMILNQVKSAN